jgi:hypothetical protein
VGASGDPSGSIARHVAGHGAGLRTLHEWKSDPAEERATDRDARRGNCRSPMAKVVSIDELNPTLRDIRMTPGSGQNADAVAVPCSHIDAGCRRRNGRAENQESEMPLHGH